MKCKSWSNKINNFVVRRLKSIKINGQQQQQQQSQQQYHTTCSTMPAMPKEKATAVSLSESNFTELKLKELATSAAVVAAMATTATAQATSMATAATSRLPLPPQQNATGTLSHQQQTTRSTCGCGAVSADVVPLVVGSMQQQRNRYMTNGHSSPLAAAAAAQATTASPQRYATASAQSAAASSTCCRISNSRSQQQQQQQQKSQTAPDVGATAVTAAPTTATRRSPKDFIFGKYIGEGSFSIVYLAVDVNTKREYAIKVCEKRHILREHKVEYVTRERLVMNSLTNVPGFVNLSCTFQDDRSLYFVMTYAKNGDLLPYINKVGSFDVNCTRHYAAELVLACEQMHKRGIVHRDLKPENILLDEDMHSLIADFGSAKVLQQEERSTSTERSAAPTGGAGDYNKATAATTPRSQTARSSDDEDDIDEEVEEEYEEDADASGTGSDDVDSPSRSVNQRRQARPPRYTRRRRGSFVGTAQYVSPEVLQNGPITPAADLWALGCIVYQMISGLPPFRGSNDYVIFKEILACNLDFPQGFDKDAEDLVRRLLRVDPADRLGAAEAASGRYDSIRAHPFFAGVDFDTVRQRTPPPIYPYLPGLDARDDEFFQSRSKYRVPDNLEPGLDDKQLTRLLGAELGTSLGSGSISIGSGSTVSSSAVEIEKKTENRKNIFDLSDAERERRLEQQKSDKWHVFADNEVILKKGYVNKRKGLFARKRMLLLTTGPRLIYIDPVQMVKKGEIPWSSDLRVEAKNFKIFFVHTPNRTYYLEDPEGFSLEWMKAIEKVHALTYNNEQATTQAQSSSRQTNSSSSYYSSSPTSSTTGARTASN